MAWTEEQLEAINLEGTNILVSAGAGSGKTAVLTERVKRKILSGVHVNELLVLTFTNAASQEMKSRIRQAIKETGLTDEANLVDSSYITTFDSFSLSIVKKYHTRLNVSNNITITDEVIIDMKKREILSEIFDRHYKKPSVGFSMLINDFAFKDDNELKEYILNAYKKIELKYDKNIFLSNYLNIFNETKLKGFVDEYLDFLMEKKNIIVDLIDELTNYFDDEFIETFRNNYSKFINASSYDEFVSSMDYGTVRVPKGSSEEGKALKENIVGLIKDFKNSYCIYESQDDIYKELLNTQESIKVIVEILIEFNKMLEDYKAQEEIFNFTDIARMAITAVEKNDDIRKDLTNEFKEIMVDEYQDTSDIQEKFISLISNNNVYMVGDIKQSIYRFRNANPDIFRSKYQSYRTSSTGVVIDLLKNFRSREEVLDDVNLMFGPIMDNCIGGADYKESHQMIFGNTLYNTEGKTTDNHHMEIITYDKNVLENIRDYEEEAFIIANDIKNRIDSKYLVWDKGMRTLRPIEYRDFVILLDRSTQFDAYRRIFEYKHIPLSTLKDYSLQNNDDSLLLKNLIKLIICIHDNNIDKEFEYAFISVSRSFLYQIDDDTIYKFFINKNYKDCIVYQDCYRLALKIDYESTSQLIKSIFNDLKYDEKILSTSGIRDKRVREEFFYNLSKELEDKGTTIFDFCNYLEEIFNGDYDLKYSAMEKTSDSVQIMTIHKSKGLEFPICYYAGFSSSFNLRELSERIIFDNQYGFVIPYVNEYYKDTILKTLLKRRVRLEEISEKIRLLYVAVTRSKEKMIFVVPTLEDSSNYNIVPNYIREKYSSFLSIFNSISELLLSYSNCSSIVATKDYLKRKSQEKIKINSNNDFIVNELEYEEQIVEDKHYSKEALHLVEKEEKELLRFGSRVHEILELIDFNNKDLLREIDNPYIRKKIAAFLDSDFMRDKINKKMYKEYEFIQTIDSMEMHGIIDLLIDMEDYYIIIDYKLKNIKDELYYAQLNGYRRYIQEKTHKDCKCYLYSIIDESFEEINYD